MRLFRNGNISSYDNCDAILSRIFIYSVLRSFTSIYKYLRAIASKPPLTDKSHGPRIRNPKGIKADAQNNRCHRIILSSLFYSGIRLQYKKRIECDKSV